MFLSQKKSPLKIVTINYMGYLADSLLSMDSFEVLGLAISCPPEEWCCNDLGPPSTDGGPGECFILGVPRGVFADPVPRPDPPELLPGNTS